MNEAARVSLAHGMRMQWEPAQKSHVLLYPEGMVQLNDTASEILGLCDGRTVAEIIAGLNQRYPEAELAGDVMEFLEDAQQRGWVKCEH